MPSRSTSTRGGTVLVDIHVNAERATEGFKAARRDINARTRAGLLAAGETVVLPEAKRRAPVVTGRLRDSLVVRARPMSAVLTTNLRGKKNRYVGLLEYGGTVQGEILPKAKQALVVNGQPVASVTTPRVYAPRRFLRDSVDSTRPLILQVVQREIMHAFDGFDR